MRSTKYVGFMAIGLGITLMVGAAFLPVSPRADGVGPFRIDSAGVNCGPAARVAFSETVSPVCETAARRRLLATTSVGVLLLAAGMALFAGGDDRGGSMVEVETRRARRRLSFRPPGRRHYKPG